MIGILSLGINIFNPLETFACTPEIQKARLKELDSQIALYTDLANSPSPKEQEEKRKAEIKAKKLLKIANSNPIIKTALENAKSQIEVKLGQEIGNIHTFAIDFGQFSLKNKQLIGTISADIQYNYGKDIDSDEQYGFETKSYNLKIDILKQDIKVEYIDPLKNIPTESDVTKMDDKTVLDSVTAARNSTNINQFDEIDKKELKKDRRADYKKQVEELIKEKTLKCILKAKAGTAYTNFDAAWYAKTYAKNVNDKNYFLYRSQGSNGGWNWEGYTNYDTAYKRDGNDCTNFISQAINHGKIAQIEKSWRDRGNVEGWYYHREYTTAVSDDWHSYTWGGAANFLHHFGYRRHSSKIYTTNQNKDWFRNNDAYKVKVGDIVAFDYTGTNGNSDWNADHIMMVTKKQGNQIWISGHTGAEINTDFYTKPSWTRSKESRFWFITPQNY